jgi:hypothetical protein
MTPPADEAPVAEPLPADVEQKPARGDFWFRASYEIVPKAERKGRPTRDEWKRWAGLIEKAAGKAENGHELAKLRNDNAEWLKALRLADEALWQDLDSYLMECEADVAVPVDVFGLPPLDEDRR